MTEPSRITDYAQNTAHVREGLAAFARQFRNSTKLRALLTAYLNQVQDLENAFWALLNDTLDNAVGVSLDQIGRILGEPRGPLSDDPYRAILRAAVKARRSNGTAEDLIEVLLLVAPLATVGYTEGSASVTIVAAGVFLQPVIQEALFRVLSIAKAGGVELQLLDYLGSDSTLFSFGTDPFFPDVDASRGFDDYHSPGTGGLLAGVYA